MVGSQTYVDVVDPNRHRTQTRSDALGRMVNVYEIGGDCGTSSYSWATCGAPTTATWGISATTTYAYSARDQLKTVTDTAGNVTTMQYDSLGRKTAMDDPDMGVWSYSYDATGNLVTQTDAKSQTLWFGYDALNRQTAKRLTSAGGTPKAYYMFNGQAAVMYTSSPSAFTDLSGDHLGSVSVATSQAQVKTQQEYDPWGKVRSGGITQTSINFTGQRLDGTGLLYYHARLYNPLLGRFVSADSLIPNPANPQDLNRYSYVGNNPLNYVDPTGHCAEGYDKTLAGCEAYLNLHAWKLNLADWTYDELKTFVDSLYDLKKAAGWNVSDYRNAMTGNGKYQLQLERSSVEYSGSGLPARVEYPSESSTTITLRVYDPLFQSDHATQLVNLVHEQAHVWDAAAGGGMSRNMMNATGSYYSWSDWGSYVAVGDTSSSYYPDEREDWAETVAATVYPTYDRFYDPATSKSRMETSRRDYIRPLLPHGEIFTGGW